MEFLVDKGLNPLVDALVTAANRRSPALGPAVSFALRNTRPWGAGRMTRAFGFRCLAASIAATSGSGFITMPDRRRGIVISDVMAVAGVARSTCSTPTNPFSGPFWYAVSSASRASGKIVMTVNLSMCKPRGFGYFSARRKDAKFGIYRLSAFASCGDNRNSYFAPVAVNSFRSEPSVAALPLCVNLATNPTSPQVD
jgi:hypothetical protein